MGSVSVHLSGHLKDYTGKKRDLEISTPRDILGLVSSLNEMFPGIRERILDDQDKPRDFVNIFLNGENTRHGDAEKTKLKDGDVVYVLPSVAGGSQA